MTCCPKCASTEAQSIEAIYKTPEKERPAIAAKMSQESEPPEARHPRFWSALTAAFVLLLLSRLSFTSETAALGVCAILSATMARDAVRYNRQLLPRLLEYWQRSFICTRCGEVFVPIAEAA